MKNVINGFVVGSTVNVSLNGVLHTRDCGTDEEAKALFRKILDAKKDPTDEKVEAILKQISRAHRVARESGLMFDPETKEVFMAGFNTPMPDLLVETLEDYIENGFPVESIENFWKLLMANPDKKVREELFGFIATHDFSLTDEGYMVVYKAVATKQENENDLPTFVTNKYLHVKKSWFTSPKRYVVYKNLETGELGLTKETTFKKWDLLEKGVTREGNLDELFKNVDQLIDDEVTVYTDMHTKTMDIQLGVPVTQARGECDADSRRECSNGLHVGATKYVEAFGGNKAPVLVCLVNPMNVIAVPEYDNSKMRVCEYYPYAVASRDNNGKIDIVEQKYFESDYSTLVKQELENLMELIKEEEEIEVSKNAEKEDREKEELLNILNSRVVELSSVG